MNDETYAPFAMTKRKLVSLYLNDNEDGAHINPSRISGGDVNRWFRENVHEQPLLLSKLEPAGYRKTIKLLSINIVRIIFDHMGAPYKPTKHDTPKSW